MFKSCFIIAVAVASCHMVVVVFTEQFKVLIMKSLYPIQDSFFGGEESNTMC